jgi:hypothetical protein
MRPCFDAAMDHGLMRPWFDALIRPLFDGLMWPWFDEVMV